MEMEMEMEKRNVQTQYTRKKGSPRHFWQQTVGDGMENGCTGKKTQAPHVRWLVVVVVVVVIVAIPVDTFGRRSTLIRRQRQSQSQLELSQAKSFFICNADCVFVAAPCHAPAAKAY